MIDTKIKICGLTTPEDAVACNALGTDYLGIVFEDSPRRVTLESAKKIRAAVPRANLVGVFADADQDSIVEAARACKLSMIQLNGHESPEYCEGLLSKTLLPIVKTFRQHETWDPARLALYQTISYFLFDLDRPSADPAQKDASRGFWAKAAKARKMGYRIILAGGLDPSNVRGAVEATRPYCVDVCHGVEKAPGLKDFEAVKQFVAEARGCFA
ncbi:MAG: N-(5'-phosphoribosyl)anthranilate isomerase [Candidatus Latescibacteria bacterium]|nr:N-(5'-phosphoribosyl)anthranilate isomerase [Candidatus Latescibacterota bacterium]NIM64403.1 N-(5'-phosphoribosyl)anthranilate isomerase [Candidatus Latescibacterota bacterium]NIO00557.1 N-(5'-phosphoribosyl)anthranilate isomerase [Candidatus Latescibacterota bacterium]NIO26957.1 N-(5'-phosphoribosyl)anthranilate isomerase [Candidatus Latescibacterota bacterium]NIO56034.1 N-(5'-phosphoribosyl)anthranilate isomerase [Candidatus Latescibacterota bacterium]